jgi:phosphoribosylglycinamide formyltransferase-1
VSAEVLPHNAPDAPAATPRGDGSLAFLISDQARACFAVRDAIARGELPGCRIALVLCDTAGAPGAAAARAAGLRTVTLEGRGRDQREHEAAVDALLRKMGVQILCLDGYTRGLSRDFIRRWPARILTLHASLLPAFPGARPERQALDFGAQVTGCTVSLLDDDPEFGPVVLQRAVEIPEPTTEAELCQRLEVELHKACIEALRRLAGGEYALRGRHFRRLAPAPAEAAAPAAEVAPPSRVSPESASGTAEIRAAGSTPGRGPWFGSVVPRGRRS